MKRLSFRRQKGFSMIELLISVVIMSIGVLGMVGLQMLAIQQNRSAMMQGEATLLANDIVDRIRANPGTTYGSALDDTFTSTTNCAGNACSEAEMAAYDILLWRCSINPIAADNNTATPCVNLGWPDTTDVDVDVTDVIDYQSFMPGGHCGAGVTVCAGGTISLTGGIYTVTGQWVDQQRVDAAGSVRSVSVSMRDPG